MRNSVYRLSSILGCCVLLCALGCGSGSSRSTSKEDGQQGQKSLTIINGSSITVQCGDSVTFTAGDGTKVVTNVVWTIAPNSDTSGTISAGGAYKTPNTPPSGGPVVVSAKDPDSGETATAKIILTNPVPQIVSITPSTVSGGAIVPVIISGLRFAPNSIAMIDGVTVPTATVSANSMAINLDLIAVSTPRDIAITITTPSPGGGISGSLALHVVGSGITYDAASRFLQQATWGATPSQIQHVQQVGFAKFLDEQFAAPAQSNVVDNDANHFEEEFWSQIARNDATQLRTKTAWALYKIFNAPGSTVLSLLTSVPETLNRDAFKTYEQIYSDVAFNINMGMYLNYCCNNEATASQLDENFARESMQVFSVGPHMLNPDGSTVLDSDGVPQPTYSNADIQGIAQAVTGLKYPSDQWNDNDTSGRIKLVAGPQSQHYQGTKLILGQTLAAGQDAAKDLTDTIHVLSNHPNTAIRLSAYLIHELVKSNPSPEYVQRVARVWASNEKGVRGDLPSVLKAILLDPEARAGDDPKVAQEDSNGGRFRDVVNFAGEFMRVMDALPNSLIQPGTSWQLSIRAHEKTLQAGSVFGYYVQSFTIPGTNTLAPEMQLYTADSLVARANYLQQVLYCEDGSYSTIEWTQWMTLASGDGKSFVDTLNHLFFHGAMSPQLASALQQNLITISDSKTRVRQTLYLALLSPEYAVER